MRARWLLAAGIAAVVSWCTPGFASPPAWFAHLDAALPPYEPINVRYEPPRGYRRLPAEPGTFSHWLRALPIRTDRMQVLSYAGRPLARPSAGIVLMDVGTRDLMQCADSVIRLHAEFLWASGRAREAAYRFTSGDNSRWVDWVSGERFVIAGSTVRRVNGSGRGKGHASYRQWLDLVFTYAGTRSLARDTPRPSVTDPVEVGDFYVEAGSPGHAVIVLDVVENAAGERLALLGQGFMPAEDIHVLRSPKAVDGVWFSLPDTAESVLDTPSWQPFSAGSRRRF